MLTKRLIGTVIIKNNLAVQSFGYNKYLPLGNPKFVIENLDRWGADEIIIMNIDRSQEKLGPNFEFVENLKKINVTTPLSYGGGIQTPEDGIKIINMGFERLVLDNLLHSNLKVARELSTTLGCQALIGCIPCSIENDDLFWLDYTKCKKSILDTKSMSKIQNILSEIIIVDWKNEGSCGGFNLKLIEIIGNICNNSLIVFGGMNDLTKINYAFSSPNVSAIAIGNSLNYEEHAIQNLRKRINSSFLRPPLYKNTEVG